MGDAVRVGRAHGVGQRNRQVQQSIEWQPFGGNQVGQRPAVDELHREEVRLAGLFDGVDRDDVGVIERSDGAGLAREPIAPIGIGGNGSRQHLERHPAIECRVMGDEHFAHASGAKRFEDLVVANSPANHGVGDIIRAVKRAPWKMPRWRRRRRRRITSLTISMHATRAISRM